MRVLKIELEGVTTSFRYPHFLVGRQPTFAMPPPATIYGHIASALGEYPDPDSFRFAYTFTHGGTVDDYEHTWLIKVDRSARGWAHPANISANMNPTLRQIFYAPSLTLYLETSDLEAYRQAFLEPRYPVLLGRSQDLASYKNVQIIELEDTETGYYEHTILPWSYRPFVQVGQGVLMPRLIRPEARRDVTWARYVTLEHRVFHPKTGEQNPPNQVMTVTNPKQTVQTDPTSPTHRERKRILVWHSLTGLESEALHNV
jgi:CRISPR-associated protein Cas5t